MHSGTDPGITVAVEPTAQKYLDEAATRLRRVAIFYRDELGLDKLANGYSRVAKYISLVPEIRSLDADYEFRTALHEACFVVANGLDRFTAHFPRYFEGAPEAPPEFSDEVAVLSPLLRKIALEFRVVEEE